MTGAIDGGPLPLASDEVHVWHVTNDDEGAVAGVLSAEEWKRAGRFHCAADRLRFVAARSALRSLISRYTGIAARDVRFSCGPYGKPYLEGEGSCALRFNVSHSGGLALLAFAIGREVGVDIQRENEDVNFMPIAQRCFSAGEMAEILKLDASDRRRAFFRGWARKEAYVKALGAGFFVPLNSFEASSPASRWLLRDLESPAGFACALAVEGHTPGVHISTFGFAAA